MLSYQDLMMHQAHYQELRREAEKERLLQQAPAKSLRANRVCCRALSRLGGQLIAWGHKLQARYGTTTTLISNHKSQLASE